jgi:glycosyltransferase involved in cell wall biosynthesis
MVFISAAMIVKNESRCIIRCLSSIVDAVDEIVIVDTGSTDNTIELIEDFRKGRKNIRLYHFDWVDDFAAARNYSLSKTRGEWKFIVDADEFLHPDDIKKVRECCKTADATKGISHILGDIEWINVENFEVKDITTTGVLRIFKGRFKYKGKIHEVLSNDYPLAMLRLNMPIRLYHDGYDPNAVNTVKKGLRNLEILEDCMREEPENYMYQIYFARQAIGINNEIAIKHLFEAERLYKAKGIKDEIAEGFMNRSWQEAKQSLK